MKFIKVVILISFIGWFSLGARSFAQHTESKTDSLLYFYQLALKPNNPDDFTKAYDYFLRHKESCIASKNINGAVYDLRLLAIIQFESGFYYDAEATAIEGIAILKNISDADYKKNSEIGFFNQIGRSRQALKDYEGAITYFNKVLERTTDHAEKASVLTNIGLVYRDQNKLNTAYDTFLACYDIALLSKESNLIATALDNLGYVEFKLGLPGALAHLEEALAIRLRNQVVYKTFPSYTHLSDYHLAQQDTALAKDYLLKAKAVSETMNSESYMLEALKKLIHLDSTVFGSRYVALNEAKTNRQFMLENKYAARKYNYELQQQIAQQNQRQKETSQLILAAVFVIGVFIVILLRQGHKKQKLREVYNTELRLSKRIHDEVANDVYQAMTQIQADQDKETVVDFLEQVYIKTRNISKENDLIKEEDNFAEAVLELISSYKNDKVKIFTKGITALNWADIQLLKRITIYRVIQELLTNMKKHSQATLVAITFKSRGRHVLINYSDDGVGAVLPSNRGPQSTENRIEAIGGKITFETTPGEGFKVHIEI